MRRLKEYWCQEKYDFCRSHGINEEAIKVMAIEMFPEEEVIRLSDNVFIHHYPTGNYKLWFNVGVQYFQIGMEHDTEEDARWHGDMLLKALSRFKEG